MLQNQGIVDQSSTLPIVPQAFCIYLNRDCPRNCCYCDVKNPVKELHKLSPKQWNSILSNLSKMGVKFVLLIGTEPLMYGEGLFEIIEHLNMISMEYGFYTTSPEPYYSHMKKGLIRAGIRNWSSGIDYIDEVYWSGKDKWSMTTHELVNGQQDMLIQKAMDAIVGMQEMSDYVEELHVLTTVSRMNIEMVPNMIKWFVTNLPKVHIGINFVERSNEESMDFASNSGEAQDFFFDDSDMTSLMRLNDEISALPKKYLNHVQTPLDYFGKYDHIVHLDRKCKFSTLAPAIDCDGSLRLCGYKKMLNDEIGISDFVLFPEDTISQIRKAWDKCKGCYWVYPYILEKHGIDGVDYRSDFWDKRIKEG